MKYTKEEVIQYVEEENVRFIRLAFCDVFGEQRNIAIMPSELRRAFDYGIAIDASAIGSFGMPVKKDLFLHPDPSTLCGLPWRSESGKVERMLCDISYADGTPFEADCRRILKESIEKAQLKGLRFDIGPALVPLSISVCTFPDHTSVPWERPEIRTSSDTFFGRVSISILMTKFVPSSGTPYVPRGIFIFTLLISILSASGELKIESI